MNSLIYSLPESQVRLNPGVCHHSASFPLIAGHLAGKKEPINSEYKHNILRGWNTVLFRDPSSHTELLAVEYTNTQTHNRVVTQAHKHIKFHLPKQTNAIRNN